MKTITRLMINEFKIDQLGYDFMGYSINKQNASYHHLIMPRRLHGPMNRENGAILNRLTAHPYLHRIEAIDLEIFNLITSEMVDENIKGRIDIENLRKINDLLLFFEKEHSADITKSGQPLIKDIYTKRLLK